MNENKKPTQREQVLQYMADFGSITPLEALRDLGVMRLASLISEIRKTIGVCGICLRDYNIYGRKIKYTRYFIPEGPTNANS